MAKFWGSVFGIAGGLAALPIGLAKGAYNAINGESFEEGMDSIVEPVYKSCGEFGEKHGDTITKAVITTSIGVVGSILGRNPKGGRS